MNTCLNGLSVINIELTSRCNKNCWMCGRRKIDREHPELSIQYGDMSFETVEQIANKLPSNLLLQFHSNGEPLLYPELGNALTRFKNQIRSFDTNGKLLLEKSAEIIDNLETLTISVIQADPEADEQYEIVKKFIEIKGNRKPFMVYRLLGIVDKQTRWYELPGLVATRMLHNPMGSFDYSKPVTIPEHGICLDLLSHLAIDRFGNCFPCVRFNPNRLQLLGNIKFMSLEEIWNSPKRLKILEKHIAGLRNDIDLCSTCDYYGIPRG